MEIVDQGKELWEEPHASQRRELYDQIAEAPVGKTLRLVAGDDFPDTETPNKYRQRIISAMRHRNVRVESRIKEGDIYLRIVP